MLKLVNKNNGKPVDRKDGYFAFPKKNKINKKKKNKKIKYGQIWQRIIKTL